MFGYLACVVATIVVTLLFIRLNPKIAKFFYKYADKAEGFIEEKTGKNI